MKPPQVGSSHGWSQTIPGIPYLGTPLLSTRFRELKVFKLTYRGFKTTISLFCHRPKIRHSLFFGQKQAKTTRTVTKVSEFKEFVRTFDKVKDLISSQAKVQRTCF